MNDVEDVWWCRTPKNSVIYGSGERRIRGQRRIALHRLLLFFIFEESFIHKLLKRLNQKNYEIISKKENFFRRKKKKFENRKSLVRIIILEFVWYYLFHIVYNKI
jgi:hypothetical protein